jgi:hypothetical protein
MYFYNYNTLNVFGNDSQIYIKFERLRTLQ